MELINIKSRKSRSQNESQALLDADPDFSGNSDNSVDSTVGIGEGLTNRQRNGQTQKSGKKNNWTLVERTVEPGDTVQKLSLLYGIKVRAKAISNKFTVVFTKLMLKVSDLKKANGLVSDQDFFALKTVKIPVKKYSFAGDLLETSTSSVPLQPPMKPTFPQDSIPLIPLNQVGMKH